MIHEVWLCFALRRLMVSGFFVTTIVTYILRGKMSCVFSSSLTIQKCRSVDDLCVRAYMRVRAAPGSRTKAPIFPSLLHCLLTFWSIQHSLQHEDSKRWTIYDVIQLRFYKSEWWLQVPFCSTINNAAFCTHGFHMTVTVNRDCTRNHSSVDICNGEVRCFLCGTDWILNFYLDSLHL
jgi:hypothetical protein